jgi:hypothetical protein
MECGAAEGGTASKSSACTGSFTSHSDVRSRRVGYDLGVATADVEHHGVDSTGNHAAHFNVWCTHTCKQENRAGAATGVAQGGQVGSKYMCVCVSVLCALCVC